MSLITITLIQFKSTLQSTCDDISRLWTIWEGRNPQRIPKLGELMNLPWVRLAAIKWNNLRPSVRVGCTIGQKLAGNAAVFCRCQFLSRKLFCDGQDLIQISGSVKLYSILPFIWHLAVWLSILLANVNDGVWVQRKSNSNVIETAAVTMWSTL